MRWLAGRPIEPRSSTAVNSPVGRQVVRRIKAFWGEPRASYDCDIIRQKDSGEVFPHACASLGLYGILCPTREFRDRRGQSPSLDVAARHAALFEVLLVVVLGPPKGRRRDDLGHDGLPELAAGFECSFEATAATCCSGVWKKMTERYWVPMSGPCRSLVVGS